MNIDQITSAAGKLCSVTIILRNGIQDSSVENPQLPIPISFPEQQRLTDMAVEIVESEVIKKAVVKPCEDCGQIMVIHPSLCRSDKKYCSPRCRSRHGYERRHHG